MMSNVKSNENITWPAYNGPAVIIRLRPFV